MPYAATAPLISVVIVNYNGGGYLQKALYSLARQTFRDFEVILIDNASEDNSFDQIDLAGLPSPTLEGQSSNLGFAAGVNRASDLAKGVYLALLNPDCVASETWLEELVKATRAHPDVAMFSSTQICSEDEGLIDGAGDNYFFIGIPWRGGYGRPVSDLPKTGECFTPCGAGALLKLSAFRDAGGFDEDFFCYCEDVDLGFRLRLRGERCVFWRPALVLHAGSAISGKNSDFTVYHGTRNRIWAYAKNMPVFALFLTAPLHIAASLYFYLRCPDSARKAAMARGLRDGWRGLRSIRSKRHEVQKSRTIGTLELLRQMTWNPAKLSQRRTDVQRNRYHRINGRVRAKTR